MRTRNFHVSDSSSMSSPDQRRYSRSPERRPRSRSRSHSRGRSRSRSGSSRRYSRSGSRRRYSRSGSRKRYSRSRSYSKSPRRSYRSRSYSRSPPRRRHRRRSRSPMSNRKRHVGNRYDPDPSRVLGVFGLSLYTGENEIRDVFSKYGPIEHVSVVYDHQSGRSRGFGFVYFEDPEDARDAKESLNGEELDGRRMRVDYSITKRPHTPTPGIYMGKPTSKPRRSYDDDHRRHDAPRRSPSYSPRGHYRY